MNNLTDEIIEILNNNKIKTLTKIQEETLPYTTTKKDVIIVSKTGSGKTLSFILPIVNKLVKNKSKGKENKKFAVIIAPTRDLVIQIHNALQIFRPLGLSSASFTDKNCSFTDEHIIVSTPGCLRSKVQKFSKIKFLVLDEADQLFGKNHEKEMKIILNYLNIYNQKENIKELKTEKRKFQIFLSTATFSESLISDFLDISKFKKVQTEKKNTQIVQYYALIPFKEKIIFFYEIVRNLSKCIIFVSKVFNTYLIGNFLKELNFNICILNGQIQQSEKNEIIKKFKNDEYNILVCTDILSRGIDIPTVENIVNFDLPKSNKDYIHRIGRTARKNKKGNSISLITQYDLESLQKIEHFTGTIMKNYLIDESQMDIYRYKVINAFEKAMRDSKLMIKEIDRNRKY